MAYVKNTLRVLVFLLVGGLLHYVLPQHDVVKITSTEIIRMDFSGVNRIFFAQADSASAELATRDIRLINTVKRQTWLLGFIRRDREKVMVYRNEDTGWIWPPYFKFDSSDLQAEASAALSTNDKEQWAVITHYGWRNRFFTVYPNAIGIRKVDGPDVTVIPWFNIFFFAFVLLAIGMIRAMWRQFRERSIDPTLEDVHESVVQQKGRLTQWLDTWRSKK
ncbi:DUF1523 family protein [Alisedimentitalea sp. MJ-SS2]|uniref:DUF1523 family protein n=1 Tax=Aliisedimentitalea sp. MJ-SS2 TaxID=3049795 RepID=UPI00290828A1|nr:DUF1523 family protein [Alisedimentitalea sp. MJ-SS2]MDU8929327.1 DUF1523 family protein [Alisedimentitalea sp. MJ-SS2]